MKAKGEQMETLIKSSGGTSPSPTPVPSKYVTAQLQALLNLI